MSDLALLAIALTPWTVPLSIYILMRMGRPYLDAIKQLFADAQRTGDPPQVAERKLAIAEQEITLKRRQLELEAELKHKTLEAKEAAIRSALHGR
jgi:hypothetical protein